MDAGLLIPIIVLVVLVALFLLYLLTTRNALVALRQRVDEAWRDITAERRQRAELIPQLVETVQGYAPHERTTFESVERARAESLAATTPAEATASENRLHQALKTLLAAADNYPQLAAGQRFLQLKGDLAEVEDRIRTSRRFYNGAVRESNTRIQVFPNAMFARRMGFGQQEFFEVADGAGIAEPPRIQF